MWQLSFISWRYWRTSPRRALAFIISVSLAVSLISAVALVDRALSQHYLSVVTENEGQRDLHITSNVDQGLRLEWYSVFEATDGVQTVVPVFQTQTLVEAKEGQQNVRLRGIDALLEPLVRPPQMVAGRFLSSSDQAHVVISQSLAQALHLGLDDDLKLATPIGFQRLQVVGIYSGLSSNPKGDLGHLVMIPLSKAQSYFLDARRFVSSFDIVLQPEAHHATVRAHLQDSLGSIATVSNPITPNEQVQHILSSLRFIWLIAATVALITASFLMANSTAMMVQERRGQFDILLQLGASRKTLSWWLVGDIACLSSLGAILGLILAYGIAHTLVPMLGLNLFLPKTMLTLPALQLLPHSDIILLTLSLSLVSCWLTAFWIIQRQLNNPQSSLQVTLPALIVAFATFGAWLFLSLYPDLSLLNRAQLLLCQTLLFILFTSSLVFLLPRGVALIIQAIVKHLPGPTWLWLAAKGMQQQRWRISTSIAALMMSLSLMVGIFGMVESYRQSVNDWLAKRFHADLLVGQGNLAMQAEVPLSEELQWELAMQPSVSLVSSQSLSFAQHEDVRTHLYVFDLANFPYRNYLKSLEGVSSDILAESLSQNHHIAIAESFALLYDFQVGDAINLTTPEGDVAFTIVSVIDDLGAASNGIIMDKAVYQGLWQNYQTGTLLLSLHEEVRYQDVSQQLYDQLSDRYPLQVWDAKRLESDVHQTINATFGFSQLITLLVVMITLIGLSNQTVSSIWQLKQELKMLSALGASKVLLTKVIVMESIFSGVIGTLLGFGLGTILSHIMVSGVKLSSEVSIAWHLPLSTYALLFIISVIGISLALALPTQLGRKLLSHASVS